MRALVSLSCRHARRAALLRPGKGGLEEVVAVAVAVVVVVVVVSDSGALLFPIISPLVWGYLCVLHMVPWLATSAIVYPSCLMLVHQLE